MSGRQVGDERARYGRKSIREELDDAWATIVRQRALVVGVLVLVGIGGWLLFLSRTVPVDQLAVGDCLYVRTASVDDPTAARPIGTEREVEQVLEAGGAERTDCHASHGHEVAATLRLGNGPLPPAPRYDPDAARSGQQQACADAFEPYVGHPLGGSAYVTFATVPTLDEYLAGERTALCLVARADGQWMTSPARGSGG